MCEDEVALRMTTMNEWIGEKWRVSLKQFEPLLSSSMHCMTSIDWFQKHTIYQNPKPVQECRMWQQSETMQSKASHFSARSRSWIQYFWCLPEMCCAPARRPCPCKITNKRISNPVQKHKMHDFGVVDSLLIPLDLLFHPFWLWRVTNSGLDWTRLRVDWQLNLTIEEKHRHTDIFQSNNFGGYGWPKHTSVLRSTNPALAMWKEFPIRRAAPWQEADKVSTFTPATFATMGWLGNPIATARSSGTIQRFKRGTHRIPLLNFIVGSGPGLMGFRHDESSFKLKTHCVDCEASMWNFFSQYLEYPARNFFACPSSKKRQKLAPLAMLPHRSMDKHYMSQRSTAICGCSPLTQMVNSHIWQFTFDTYNCPPES